MTQNKAEKTLVVILLALIISIIFMWYTDRLTISNIGDDTPPIDYRLREYTVSQMYFKDITNCNLSLRVLQLESVNASQIVIGEFTDLDEWHKNCLEIAETKKTLIEKEFGLN